MRPHIAARVRRAAGSPRMFVMGVLAVAGASAGPDGFGPRAFAQATIIIQNEDGPGEGFNDPTPFTPAGGNTAVTLGQARLKAFQHAADIWAAGLESNVIIVVRAQMNPLFCDDSQAILGSAGASTVHANFPNAPVSNTWYCQALANSLAGVDLDPTTTDLAATFNSDLNGDAGCLGGIGWYYGFDGNPGGDIDFVTVVLHEIGHGLGFQTFADVTNGARLNDRNDTYMLKLEQAGVATSYALMSDAQRVDANRSDPNLRWTGTSVTAQAALVPVTGGLSGGKVRLHAPNPIVVGASVSHFSSALVPGELMEPAYAGSNHDVGLALNLMQDIGWPLDLLPPEPPGPSPAPALLEANAPNPFDPETTIRYRLAQPGRAAIRVYDAAGRLVRTLENRTHPAGSHETSWDGTDAAGRPAASGVYFCNLQAADFSQTRRLVLIRAAR